MPGTSPQRRLPGHIWGQRGAVGGAAALSDLTNRSLSAQMDPNLRSRAKIPFLREPARYSLQQVLFRYRVELRHRVVIRVPLIAEPAGLAVADPIDCSRPGDLPDPGGRRTSDRIETRCGLPDLD